MKDATKATPSLFYLSLFLSIWSPSLAQPNIVKTLPGFPGDLPFTLETGYVGVGESEQVQLFYYFVESERDVENDPLMLWLTGGPGCSAFSGLIFEIGPLKFNLTATNSGSDIPKLRLNQYSWSKVASIIFVDSPVGTGFSYATTSEAYYTSDTLQSTHIYDFLRKWLIKHPKFSKHPLYITGDSYSGIIIPVVVQEILHGNEIGLRPNMNFKGYVIGNPITENNVDVNARYEYAHRMSLLSDEIYKVGWINCKGDFNNVDANNTKCLKNLRTMDKLKMQVNAAHVLEHSCGYASPKPPLHDLPSELHITGGFCRDQRYLFASSWANDERVREALHIREGSIGNWVRCNKSLAYEYNVPSGIKYHQDLVSQSLQVLIYSGDQDMLAPYLGTLKWIKGLQVPIRSDWRPWFVDGQVSGYTTVFSQLPYRLAYTTIKGGGHTAPEYKPRECLAMMERWFENSPL